MRRFEHIRGNKANYWEIARKDATIITRSGKIGSNGSIKEKVLGDYMAAEVEFDRLIRDRIKRGFKEVAEASSAPEQILPTPLELVTVDEQHVFNVEADFFKYVMWRAIEIGLFVKEIDPPDLSRWDFRVTRRLRLEETPAPGEDMWEAWVLKWLEMTSKERAQRADNQFVVPAYKYLDDSNWIVSPEECLVIANRAREEKPKRHKASQRNQTMFDEWAAFHTLAAEHGGYTVYIGEEAEDFEDDEE